MPGGWGKADGIADGLSPELMAKLSELLTGLTDEAGPGNTFGLTDNGEEQTYTVPADTDTSMGTMDWGGQHPPYFDSLDENSQEPDFKDPDFDPAEPPTDVELKDAPEPTDVTQLPDPDEDPLNSDLDTTPFQTEVPGTETFPAEMPQSLPDIPADAAPGGKFGVEFGKGEVEPVPEDGAPLDGEVVPETPGFTVGNGSVEKDTGEDLKGEVLPETPGITFGEGSVGPEADPPGPALGSLPQSIPEDSGQLTSLDPKRLSAIITILKQLMGTEGAPPAGTLAERLVNPDEPVEGASGMR